jgi:hypothetical protein
MMHRHRVGFRPAVEGIEARLLLSATSSLVTQSRPHQAAIVARAGADPASLPPNPLLSPSGQPTPHEQARQRFVAKFVGTFTVGTGRFTSEAQQLYFRGSGGSNQMLHGDTQLRMITPSDPSQPLGGEMSIFDRNINNNSALGLDLSADPATDLDSSGRPIRMTITQLDVNLSGGIYGAGLAAGTVEIRYKPSSGRSPGVLSQGTAVVTVRAQIYSLGTNGILKNADIDPGGPSQGPRPGQ